MQEMFQLLKYAVNVLILYLDPYEKARGGETVLHWACQSKVKNEKLVAQLLTVSAK